MKLYLIRHGKTMANEQHLYCGSTDLPLSETGVEELKNLHYEAPVNCRYITSGMLRTEQTLACLFGDVEHKQDSRFAEVDFGIFEMHSYEELKDCEEYQAWISGNNEKNIPPQGESGEQMLARVLHGLQDVLATGQDTILITHGGVIAGVMAYLFPEVKRNRYSWQPKPGQGYIINDTGYEELG